MMLRTLGAVAREFKGTSAEDVSDGLAQAVRAEPPIELPEAAAC